MDNHSRENQDERKNPVVEPKKKPYEKPAIIHRAPLEAMAAVCRRPLGKAPLQGCGVRFS